MRHLSSIALAIVMTLTTVRTAAVTRAGSADGQFWDIQDTSPWSQDSGGIATGGRANPFNGFGYLKLQVRRPDGTPLVRNQYLTGFGLASDGAGRFDSITPVLRGDIVVARAIYAPPDTDYLRYVDGYTNVAAEDRLIEVAWGGAVGAYEDGGLVAVATTSSGDRRIDVADTFVTVMQNARRVDDPMRGPSGHGPSAHVLGTRSGVLTAVGDMYTDPFADRWPGFDPAHIGYVFKFSVRPGETKALMTFVAKGLSEVYGSRGAGQIPAAGSEIARVTEIARRLAAAPDVRGLTALQRSQIANWNVPARAPAMSFSVIEKTVEQIQDAITTGTTSMRSGPPAACAARSTAFRSRSRTTSTSSICRRPAAHLPSWTIALASTRGWPRGCVAAAR